MRMSAGRASFGHMAIALVITFTSSTPLAGLVTFSQALEITVRAAAQQQKVCCRALDRRDPSTIIPNNLPHTAHVARTPSASTDSRCSFAARAGRRLEYGGGWRSSTAQGLYLSS